MHEAGAGGWSSRGVCLIHDPPAPAPPTPPAPRKVHHARSTTRQANNSSLACPSQGRTQRSSGHQSGDAWRWAEHETGPITLGKARGDAGVPSTDVTSYTYTDSSVIQCTVTTCSLHVLSALTDTHTYRTRVCMREKSPSFSEN